MLTKALTQDSHPILSDKLFHAINKYRIIDKELSAISAQIITPENSENEEDISREVDLITSPLLDKISYLHKAYEDGLSLQEEDLLTPDEDKILQSSALGKKLVEKDCILQAELNRQKAYQDRLNRRLQELKHIQDEVYKDIHVLYTLKTRGFLTETELNQLQYPSKRYFYLALIETLSFSQSNSTQQVSYKHLYQHEIEALFSEVTTQKIQNTKNEKELYKVLKYVSFFNCSNGTVHSDTLIQNARNYLHPEKRGINQLSTKSPVINDFTRLYGYRNKIATLKTSVDLARKEKEDNKEFYKF